MIALPQFHFKPTLFKFGLLQFIYADLRGSYQYVEMKWNEEFITKYREREREREREKYLQMGLWWQSGRLRCETILGRRTRDGNHKQILKKTVPSLPYSSSELPILQEKWSRYIKHFHLHIS